MKRSITLGTLGTLLFMTLPLRAQELPHLDFVRGLREKAYPDLALEYLEKLSKNPPASIAAVLPFEMAKTRMELARKEADGVKRMHQYQEARTQLEEFVRKNANHPRTAEARLEIARVTVQQGKTQLNQALRQETRALRQSEALKARSTLEEAEKLIAMAAPQIDAQLAKLKGDPRTPQEATEKKDLEKARIQAKLDQGLVYLELAQTYVDKDSTDVLKKRAAVVKKAITTLTEIAVRDSKEPLHWLARAWLGRALHENGDPKGAREKYEQVINDSPRDAVEAQRLARYFRMLVLPEAQKSGETALNLIQKSAEFWIDSFPAYLDTPEGCGVRFELAQALMKQAASIKDPGKRLPLTNRAKDLYRQLELTDSEFAERARQAKVAIIKEQGGLNVPVVSLRTFDDCYVRVQFEAFAMAKDAATIEDPKKLEEKRKDRFKTMNEALTRAFDLAKKDRVPEQDLANARSLQVYVYLISGDYKSTIEVGEDWARNKPRTSQAPTLATYALQAYASALADPQKAGLTRKEEANAYRERLRNLADYMVKTWPDDQAAEFARHQIALMLLREGKLAEGIDLLERIKPTYNSAIMVSYQLAMAAFQAKEKNEPVAAGKPSYQARGFAALERMPELPATADSDTARLYLLGKIELGKEHYKNKKYKEMEALAEPLQRKLQQLKLPEAVMEELQAGVASLMLYAQYGQADTDFNAGRIADVRKRLDPVIDKVKARAYPELAKNPQLRWGLLSLALRASIQEGNSKRAQEVITLLQSFAGQNDLEGGATATLVQIVQMLREQMQELRRKGAAARPQLEKMTASFTALLDDLAKPKSLAPETLIFLAQGYSSLDKHAKAANLLLTVPEPNKDADPQKLQLYHAIRILYIRELRLDKKIDEANKLLDQMMGTKENPGWAQNNLDAQKEKLLLLETQGKYTTTLPTWNALVNQLRGKIQDPRTKEQYFECYYQLTHAYLRYADGLSKDPKDAKRAEATVKAASFITKLETSWPDLGGEASKNRFMELLDSEPLLKEQYVKLKGSK